MFNAFDTQLNRVDHVYAKMQQLNHQLEGTSDLMISDNIGAKHRIQIRFWGTPDDDQF